MIIVLSLGFWGLGSCSWVSRSWWGVQGMRPRHLGVGVWGLRFDEVLMSLRRLSLGLIMALSFW